MRLTLRTLLAWLDDTLPPPEVRQIGQQVTESQFAQKLVERIGKVTRRRRLSVPSATGTDQSDPATVAAYLDNELSAEEVAEFEKRCLESDVQLAEVASVHQILSLIGQKAKVPTEAKHRMYRLIKGRESIAPRESSSRAEAEPEPAAALLPPWQPPPIPPRSVWERFGPVAGVAGLLCLMIWSAWQIAGPSAAPEPLASGELTHLDGGAPAAGHAHAAKEGNEAAKGDAATEKPAEKEGAEAPVATKPDAPAPEPTAGAEPPKVPEAPPGSVGVAGKIDGVALRFVSDNAGSRWTRLDSRKGLQADDRIIGLAPFRTPIKVGSVPVDLVGNSEVRVLGPAGDDPARLDLIQGRVVIAGSHDSNALAARFGGQTLRIMPPANGVVALERLGHRVNVDQRPMPAIRIYVPDGEAKFTGEVGTETVTGPASVLWQPPSKLVVKSADAAPAWVTETTPTPVDLELGRQFARYFAADRPVDTSLNEALEDEQGEVRRLAISALGTVGALEMIVPAMSTPGRPESRRAAIAVLRAYQARGTEAAKQVFEELRKGGGDEWAKTVEKLLEGYTPREAADEATYVHLVQALKNPDLSVRELAIENLEALTGSDSKGYDPDQPQGPGFEAWQGALKRKELLSKPGRAAAKEGS
jgi:hypothetical protein